MGLDGVEYHVVDRSLNIGVQVFQGVLCQALGRHGGRDVMIRFVVGFFIKLTSYNFV